MAELPGTSEFLSPNFQSYTIPSTVKYGFENDIISDIRESAIHTIPPLLNRFP